MAPNSAKADGQTPLSSVPESESVLATERQSKDAGLFEKRVGLDEIPGESDSSGVTEFKEGGYGWAVVTSVAIVNAHTWGLNSSYAVFLAHYLRSGSIGGSSPLAFAFVGGLSISISLLVSPLVTWCIGRFGTVPTFRVGVVLEAVSFIGASFSTHVWHLLLSQGLCFGLGLGFCFTSTVGVVPQWFTKQRSFANGVAAAGSGFGGLTYSLATNAMITNLGLAWAFRILAILAFVVNGACSLVLKDRNKAIGAKHVPFHKDLFKLTEYWLFLGWGFFSLLGYVIVVFSISDYARQVGFSASQGSLVAAMFNLSQGLGRPLIGLASDRVGRINIAGLGSFMASIAAFLLWILAGKNYAGLIVYSLFGAFAGSIWPCVAPVGAEVVGIQLLPAALSIYWLALVLPATFAEVIALKLKTSGVNGYISVQLFTAIMFVVSFVFIWFLRSWKLEQIELMGLNNEKGETSDDAKHPSKHRGGLQKLTLYIKNMFAIKRV